MSKIDKSSIVLDQVENTIRKLLLDVVDFIEKNPVSKVQDGNASQVHISEELAKAPLQLRWTGGWVRDKLLKVDSKDIDIAINKMTGYHFGLRLKEYLDEDGNAEKYLVPGSTGTVSAKLHKIEANPDKSKKLETTTTRIFGLDLDLVNLRKETYTSDSRNPKIEFGSPEEDALRRDATINAMFYNIHTSLVEDLTGKGLEDLENGIIRTPLEPQATFIDDPLRVLRLIRFATRYDYKIEESALTAMGNENIKDALVAKITRERVWQELEKMLKGRDPKAALSYINRLGLYDTIFMAPDSPSGYKPDTSNWAHCYNTVAKIVADDTEELYETLHSILTKTPEEAFHAWMLSTLVPWTEAPSGPPLKSGRPSPPIASIVARDGLKAPAKISDLAAASIQNQSAIKEIVASRSKARDVIGMQIRSWGATWRQQLLFSLLYEIYSDPNRTDQLLRDYTSFLVTCKAAKLLEAYDMRPLINGNDLCEALDLPPGTWTKTALDVVMAWQLRNPQITDNEAALQEVRAWKETADIKLEPPKKKKPKRQQGELTSVLTSHFLQLTLRPLFSQTPNNPKLTSAGRRNINASPRVDTSNVFNDDLRPWKNGDAWALDLLSWVCKNLDANCVEREWGVLIPPILTVLDDTEVHIKTKGCFLMNDLLQSTPPLLLKRTGLGPVFQESLMGCTTYLPTLTAEDDSIAILNAAYPALVTLGDTLHQPSAESELSSLRVKYFSDILRNSILAAYRHAGENVRVATTLLSQLPPIVRPMGIDSVVHLKNTIPLLRNILADPFAPASPSLASAALHALKTVIECGWPRISHWRVDILNGVCKLWLNLADEDPSREIAKLQDQLKDIMIGLTSAVLASGSTTEVWMADLQSLLKADDDLHGLLADTLDGPDTGLHISD